MAVSSATKYLGLTASVVTIIQGIAWTCLTLMAILVHTEAWKPKLSIINYGDRLTYEIVTKYLNKTSAKEALGVSGIILGPKEFFYCNIVYLIVSILWIGAATFQLWGIWQQNTQKLKYSYLTFGIVTITVCIYDVIIMSLFANDYNAILTKVNSIPDWNVDHAFAILACGVLMTICARGFILWIVNLTFGILITKLSFEISTQELNNFNVLDAFGSPSPVDPSFPHKSIDSPNEAFGTFLGLPRLPPIQSTNERLTNLTKVKRSAPPAPPPPPNYLNRSYLHNANSTVYTPDSSSVNSSIRKPRFQTTAAKNRNQQY